MTLGQRRELLNTLRDEEYRREFVSEHVGVGLASQIQQLRQKRDWTQEELARRTNKAQETVSRWENPDYGRFSLSTLKEVAAAFDVALLVRFVPFGDLADWTIGLTPQRLAPKSFVEEQRQPTVYDLQLRYRVSSEARGITAAPEIEVSGERFLPATTSGITWEHEQQVAQGEPEHAVA